MTIYDIIIRRQISEVLHFTTNFGLVGILTTKSLKCKDLLAKEDYLAHILRINTRRVLDPGWSDYVHLSISRINSQLFGCSGNWHRDVRWRILAFDPAIMMHPDVYFVTTNNAYFQHHRRNKGATALEELFKDKVKGRYGHWVQRTSERAINETTCEQAEVLYPKEVSIDFLRKIYVQTPDDENQVAAQLYTTEFTQIEVVAAPEKFVC